MSETVLFLISSWEMSQTILGPSLNILIYVLIYVFALV